MELEASVVGELSNHGTDILGWPRLINLAVRPSCQTESKTFSIAKRTNPVVFLLFQFSLK